MSDGGLTHFVHANKPEGAPTHCLDGCPHEKSCPYFAPKLYLTQITDVSWPTTAVSICCFAMDYMYLHMKTGSQMRKSARK